MIVKKFLILFELVILASSEHFDGCHEGWYRYKDYKCVIQYDLASTYAEAHEYCKTAFGATLLNITSEEERVFWSFQLIRHSNMSANVWLETNQTKLMSQKESNCYALRSLYGNDNYPTGAIIEQSCKTLGTTVCEIVANKKIAKELPVKDFNVNKDYIPNTRMNFKNGTRSEFFTGIYYVITSKFKNASLNNQVLGKGKCSLVTKNGENCASHNQYNDINGKYADYYTFTNEGNNFFQIRKFNSDKLLVFENEKFLVNFKAFEDGLSPMGKEATKESLQDNLADALWQFQQYNNSGYYVITSRTKGYTLGVVEYKDGKNLSIGFGLYDPVNMKEKLHDKLLFNIEPLNYTLDVDLISIEFDKTLEQIVASNKKQISIIETAIINNNSPASLTHEVSSTKDLTEMFTASYGTSQEFMQSFSNRNDFGTSSTDSSSDSKSFTDSASEAISSSLTQSVSQSHSEYDYKHDARQTDSEAHGGWEGFGFNIGGSIKRHSEHEHNHENRDAHSNSNSSTNSDSHANSNSSTHEHGNTNSNTNSNNNSKEEKNGNKSSNKSSLDQTVTNKRTYAIHKTVNLPPFSAVKISSYANWINDISIQFKLKLKFSARSFRRSMTGDGANSWRTVDAEFVEYLMDKHKFKGDILKTTYDSVYGQISGYMRASVGLESVFISKRIELNQDN